MCLCLQMSDMSTFTHREIFLSLDFLFLWALLFQSGSRDTQVLLIIGNDVANHLIAVLLNTSVFGGGLIPFVLDNFIPGTDEEIRLIKWREQGLEHNGSEGDQLILSSSSIYDLPFGMNLIKRYKIFKYIPIIPTSDQNSLFGSVRSLYKTLFFT
ncbi:solute carrier family 23 member 2-like isoform X1 [Tachypleus tridentatus]|uniref:solute carrier family 23 member 2-like isoform X1 n=1 Tax=Tachypleus tridentatus TaxID=6853 RepID=UPI003FD5DD97